MPPPPSPEDTTLVRRKATPPAVPKARPQSAKIKAPVVTATARVAPQPMPSDAVMSGAVPSDAVMSDAVPSDAVPSDAVRAELAAALDALDAAAMRVPEEDVGEQGRAREAHELVEAARSGDPRAFEALVKRYRHRIFALALHMTGSPSDADDITQDAFVRAYKNIQRFEGRSEFFTWLYRIALNRALNVRRDRTRRRTADLDDPRVTVAVAVDSNGDPHRALELRQTYTYLVRAFDRLSPLLKTTIALTMMQGLSYPEAAVVLETTEGTIAWRIHEARKQMRNALDSMFKDPTPLRVADIVRARKAAAAAREAVPEASPPPALEMALALLAPSV
ncbi:MAG: RNA polymerase sigma factor [Myxococcota bacterium]|nr:RNA polymerase sigma factor [Myxococcota bacterium]